MFEKHLVQTLIITIITTTDNTIYILKYIQGEKKQTEKRVFTMIPFM